MDTFGEYCPAHRTAPMSTRTLLHVHVFYIYSTPSQGWRRALSQDHICICIYYPRATARKYIYYPYEYYCVHILHINTYTTAYVYYTYTKTTAYDLYYVSLTGLLNTLGGAYCLKAKSAIQAKMDRWIDRWMDG